MAWAPFNIEAGNEDITAYAGHGRLSLAFAPRHELPLLGRAWLDVASHFSLAENRAGLFTNLEASIGFAPPWLRRPPFGQAPPRYGLFVQWVVGRGTSLIEYSRFQNTVRLGLRLF